MRQKKCVNLPRRSKMKKNSGEATVLIIMLIASIPIFMSIVSDFKMHYKQRVDKKQKAIQHQATNQVEIANEKK